MVKLSFRASLLHSRKLRSTNARPATLHAILLTGDKMDNIQLTQVPVMKTGMLIRKPVAEVFEAFVNPDVTT